MRTDQVQRQSGDDVPPPDQWRPADTLREACVNALSIPYKEVGPDTYCGGCDRFTRNGHEPDCWLVAGFGAGDTAQLALGL